MEVIRSGRAGFCMGVALALKKLDDLVEKGGHVGTFGPIIHNPFVLEEYAMKGVRCFGSVQAVKEALEPFYAFSETIEKEGGREEQLRLNLLIRAHGIPHSTESFLRSLMHVSLMDATCPRVKEAQNAIARATQGENGEAVTLLLFGDANHPEVDGLVSYAKGKYIISPEPQKLIEYAKKNQHELMVLAAQTTQDRPLFDVIKKELCAVLDRKPVILETICDATKLRQEEALAIAEQVDAMVVVGGKESGNTKRLAELVFSKNIPTVLVESADELEREFFQKVNKVGLTAGASTPKRLVDEAERVLSSW